MENWRNYLRKEQNDSSFVFGPARELLYRATKSISDDVINNQSDLNNIKYLEKMYFSTAHLPQGNKPRTPEQQREMRDIIDYKRDAFRHILANAWFGQKYPEWSMKAAGETVEFFGALKNFFLKAVKKGKFDGFDSGRQMDIKNNELGLKLAKKFIRGSSGKPDLPLKVVALEVKELIDTGRFFVDYKGQIVTYRELDMGPDPIRPPPQEYK